MKFLDAIRTVRSIGRYRKLVRAEDVVLDLAVSLEDTDWETDIKSEVYLWEHCNKDAGLVSVLKEFEVDRDRFIEVYMDLINLGAGQWKRGRFVAGEALANPFSLRYCLSVFGEYEANSDEARTMAYNLIMYYEGDKSALQGGPYSEIIRFGPRIP